MLADKRQNVAYAAVPQTAIALKQLLAQLFRKGANSSGLSQQIARLAGNEPEQRHKRSSTSAHRNRA